MARPLPAPTSRADDDEDEDRPLHHQPTAAAPTVARAQQGQRRPLAVTAAVVAVVVALVLAAVAALSRCASPRSPPSSSSFWRRGAASLFARAPPELPVDIVNDPYYQARLRPLALSLGPRHPIAARRPPHAVFADVRLPANGSRLAALLAASDGGDPSGVPTDAQSYELFVAVTDERWEEVDEVGEGGNNSNVTAPPPRKKRRQWLTCLDAAKRLLPEPFHPSMLVRNRTVPSSWAAAAAAANTGDEEPPPNRWCQPPHPHPTKLSPSLWRWDAGAITREAFESVPFFLGDAKCVLCYDVLRYKIYRGALYRRTGDCARELFNASAPLLPPGKTRCPADWPPGQDLEEILLAATYLYRLPDADLAVHRGDGAAVGHPVLQSNVRRDDPMGGFALPYPEHWNSGPLSARQVAGWAACTRARYGLVAGRRRKRGQGGGGQSASNASSSSCARSPLIPRAVWRGSTTDPYGGAWLHQLLGMARARLHLLSLVHRDVLDARITAVRQMDLDNAVMRADKAADERLLGIRPSFPGAESESGGAGGEAAAARLADCRLRQGEGDEDDADDDNNDDDGNAPPHGPRPPLYVPMEDYSRYAAVLDVDGNGWSSRLFSLLSGASARPVLKQATGFAAVYEHLFSPGRHFAHFRGDLRDVDDVARRWVGLVDGGGGGGGGEGGEEGGRAKRRRAAKDGDKGGDDGRAKKRRAATKQRRAATKDANDDVDDDDDDPGSRPSSAADADAMAAEAASLASLTLNKWALVESAAASLEAYGERLAWRVEAPRRKDGWDRVPWSACCTFGGLPAELLEAMRAAED